MSISHVVLCVFSIIVVARAFPSCEMLPLRPSSQDQLLTSGPLTTAHVPTSSPPLSIAVSIGGEAESIVMDRSRT